MAKKAKTLGIKIRLAKDKCLRLSDESTRQWLMDVTWETNGVIALKLNQNVRKRVLSRADIQRFATGLASEFDAGYKHPAPNWGDPRATFGVEQMDPSGHEAGTSVLEKTVSSQESHVEWFSELADEIAAALTSTQSFSREKGVASLVRIALQLSGAEVGACRIVGHDQEVTLDGEAQIAEGCNVLGRVPERKHRDDCRPTATTVEGGARDARLVEKAAARCHPDGSPWYAPDEIEHFQWLRSEAFIPLLEIEGVPQALLILGHSRSDHFSAQRLAYLRKYHGLFQGLYELSEFTHEQQSKSVLLQHIAEVLPAIAAAENEFAFARATCTLLTCQFGFGFDRAMFFSMKNGIPPAECTMAIGGVGDDWPQQRRQFAGLFATLREYIGDGLAAPRPGDGKGAVIDPLFAEACSAGSNLIYQTGDSKALDEFLETGIGTNGPVLRLDGNDSWIAAARSRNPNLFRNSNNQFFAFRLRPVEIDGAVDSMGFIVADLPYRPHRHQPRPGFPDLAMAAFTLQLLAGLWKFRNDASTYFHILGAMPVLRHRAGNMIHLVDAFKNALPPEAVEAVGQPLKDLETAALEIDGAKVVIDQVSEAQQRRMTSRVKSALDALVSRAKKRYPSVQVFLDIDQTLDVAVRIHQDALEAIVFCLLDNAATHGKRDEVSGVECRISGMICDAPAGSGTARKLLLCFENNGVPINKKWANFLFCDRVSTRPRDSHGSGLSAARQIAVAHGGDVVLLSCEPPSFGLVLSVVTPNNAVEAKE